MLVCFFFFSSRRRHTRYWRDWSSDVCSSDLSKSAHALWPAAQDELVWGWIRTVSVAPALEGGEKVNRPGLQIAEASQLRSEERRVGKECRSRWSPYH